MIHVLNPNRGPTHTYYDLHRKVYQWIDDGEFQFGGSKSYHGIADLDLFIVKVFKFHKMYPHDDVADQINKLDNQIRNGTIRLPWLDSEHALALWKAMVERHA